MKIFSFLISLKGYAFYGLAFLLGGLLTLAFPPVHWLPFAFLGLGGFYLLLQNKTLSLKEAFWGGWFFGLGHFATGLYWITYSLGVDLEQFWWLVPFSILGFPIVLGFFIAFVSHGTKRLPLQGIGQWLAFGILWVLMEWVRGHIFTGLPWNLLGYMWMPLEGLLQITAWVGIYGLSFLTVLFLTAPALCFSQQKKPLLLMTLLMSLLWGGGSWRLHENPTEFVPHIHVRLVQPNISQKEKWVRDHVESHFQEFLALCRLPSEVPVTHLIGPESVVPFDLNLDLWHRAEVASVIPSQGALLLGTPRFEKRENGYEVWNSFVVLNARQEILGFYDKNHLVPFGEYIPFRQWAPGMMKKITKGDKDYSTGKGLKTLHIEGLPPFSPVICYEIIFPGEVALTGAERPQWLLTLTNDAWFGESSGPYQHFAMSRVRAIEEGLPLVRVANTGISGVTDAYGRIQGILGLGEKGVLDSDLPRATPEETFYARHRETPLWILLIVLSCFVFVLNRRSSVK